MKYYRNPSFSFIISILLFILNFKFLKGGKCDGCSYDYESSRCKNGDNYCSSDCKPHFYGECYDCGEALKKNASNLYEIGNNGECYYAKSLNRKYIISETNEVVDDQTRNQLVNNTLTYKYYKFGDFIYKQCPTPSQGTLLNQLNMCTCRDDSNSPQNKTYWDTIFGKALFRCVSSCPYGYYYDQENNNICRQNCERNIRLDKGCASDCPSGENYNYTEKGKNYCLGNCPSSAPFFYTNENSNPIQCLSNCSYQDFYLSNTKECKKSCGSYRSLIDLKTSTFICDTSLTTTDNCPPDFPYEYDNSCLRNCSDTNDAFFSTSSQHFANNNNDELKKVTYSLILTNKKICVPNCTEYNLNDNDKKFYDTEAHICIKNCTETSKKYYKGHECVESCDKYHNFGEFECIDECDTGTFKYNSTQDKVCYSDCKDISPIFYYDKDRKECFLECDKYIFKEKKEGVNPDTLYCLDKCNGISYTPSPNGESTTAQVNLNYFHKYDDNICIENCTVNDEISKYYYIKDDSNKVCHKSCKDIANDKIYEHNSLCFDSISDKDFKNNLHYKMKSGVNKYKHTSIDDESELAFCSKAGFYYTKDDSAGGKECTNCDGTGDYKIPYSLDENGIINNLGQCLGSSKCITTNNEYPYYNEVDKVCHNSCNLKIILDDSNQLDNTLNSNCVSECPSNYYESSEGTHCYKNNCPNNEKFYQIGTRKKCIQNCTTISKFYIEDSTHKECLDTCNIASKFYYIPGNINNKCLDKCSDQEKYSFSLRGSAENPQPCLEKCPLRFQYYSNDASNQNDYKICLPKCPVYFISETKECVSSCSSPNEYIINENECAKECTRNATFIAYSDDNKKKCVINCDSTHHFYYEFGKLSTGEIVYKCTGNCTTNSSYNLQYGSKCVKECPEETFLDGDTCKLKCESSDSKFKRIISTDGTRSYKCTNACGGNEYIGSNNECIEQCPREENFVNGQQCQTYCDNYYKKKDGDPGHDEFGYYTIYECLDSCNDGLVLDGTKECVTGCTEDKPYLLGKVCVSICLKDQIKPFSAYNGTHKICAEKCSNNNGLPRYYGDDKICVDSCGIFEHKKYHNEKENDYSCVSHCDLKSENRFSYYKDEKYYCLTKCTYFDESDTKKYYSTDDYICDTKCNDRNPFLIPSQNICTSKCPDNLVANPSSTDDDKNVSPYRCEYTCDQGKYYYENERICGQCKPNHYIIQGSQKCIEFCDQINSQKNYYYYEASEDSNTIKNNTCVTECPEDKPFIDYNNHCSKECTQESHKFYSPIDKKCMDKCPEGTLTNGDKCVVKCPSDKVEDSIAKVCLDDCLNAQKNYIYYYEPDRVCLKECKPGDFIFKDGDKYKCMNNCSNVNEGLNRQLYIDGNKCVETCPYYRRYFVNQTAYGEQNISKYCMTDCPIGYEFYKYNNFECSGICTDYYITNKDPYVNAKECVKQCDGIYPFIFMHNNTHKECVEFCPGEKMFYDESKTCYEECPSSSPFHEKGSFECLKECKSKIANKKTMECVTDCEVNQFWANEGETKMCYDNCNQTNYALFSTFERKCVKECVSDNPYLQGNLVTGECECRGLYYIKDNGLKDCFDPKIKLCTETNTDYKIQVNGTNQCTKVCFGVLSVDEDVCYWGNADSIKCPENSMLGIFNGNIKCECQYGFYMNLKNKKICLDSTLKCPDYKYFNTQTRECVPNCGDLFLLDDKCYSYCPSGMNPDQDKKTCTCAYNFYRTEEDKYVCLGQDDQCPSEYPYFVEEKKECVKECSKEYPISYDMKCHSDCAENYYKIKDPNNPDKYICVCQFIWYYESDKSICDIANKENKCKNLGKGLDYTVVKTKQCVSSCKGDYKYFFNKECYYNCSEANLVKDENSNECKCKEKWRITNDEIECIPNCNDNENLITETNQCIPKTSNCSFEKPLLWNNLCYSKCPENTMEDSIKGNTCKCLYNWFIRNDGLIECMEKDKECPYDSHPYLIYQTKQCVKTKDDCDGKYIFNFVCYDKCPSSTIAPTDENNKNCECDPDAGYWAKGKDQYGRDVLECPITDCNTLKEKRIYYNDTRECVSNCEEISKYSYLGVCYSKCPPLTTQVNNEFSCKLTTEFEDPDLKVLLKNVEDKLQEINIPSGGIVINNEENDAKIQIYKLDKDEKKNKEALLRSNLAYIDISECIEKIRKNNKMVDEDEQVVVIKLDLKSTNKKLIVNPVEYEFRHSKTGALLDASVCGRNEVVVSYPLSYLFKNKRKLRLLDDEAMMEIGEKFERGKLLYEKDNSIDSFNYNSSIYSDICYPIEVDGKDLTLENRISYFYPNYSFCESTCMYDYTDFVNERIFCNCSIKLKLDVDRPQGVKLSEYNKDETDSNQMGPTNIPVMTCLPKVKITGNPAFYVCLIFFIVQVGLLFIIIFKSLSSLIINIKKKLFKEEELNDSNVEEDFKMNIKVNKEIDIGKTSERKLNNPPKKNNFVENKISVKEKIPISEKKKKKIIAEKNKFDDLSEGNNSENYYNYLKKNEIEADSGFFTSVKKEEKYLREFFSVSMTKDKFDIVVVVLTSIFDKIYLSKILLLSGKYQMTSLMFSLYLLCHLLLLTLCALFFDIKTIGKIFENENYPSLGYYILYGFLGNLIVWVIFKLFYCLIDNTNNIRKLFIKNNSSFNNVKKMGKLNKLISIIKRNIIIYLVIQFVLIILCSFYLIVFCGIYTGTKTKVFLSYAFAVITIVIIKVIYGLILGILRKISLFAEKSSLYNVVLYFNKYIS